MHTASQEWCNTNYAQHQDQRSSWEAMQRSASLWNTEASHTFKVCLGAISKDTKSDFCLISKLWHSWPIMDLPTEACILRKSFSPLNVYANPAQKLIQRISYGTFTPQRGDIADSVQNSNQGNPEGLGYLLSFFFVLGKQCLIWRDVQSWPLSASIKHLIDKSLTGDGALSTLLLNKVLQTRATFFQSGL